MPRTEGGRRAKGSRSGGSEDKPLVSVVTVVFNGARYMEEAITAVASQTYPHVEHVVIDGGSTDGTVDILRRYDDTIGYWVSEPDDGVYDAMNKGVMQVADPESYVLFANSDDRLQAPDVLARAISASDGEDMLYGRMLLTDGQVEGVAGRPVNLGDLAFQTLCHPSTLVRRKIFDTVGMFDTRYAIAADYDHIVRCFAAGISTRFVDVVVSRMRMGGLSEEQFMRSCRERKDVIRRRFPFLPRLGGIWQVNLYDIPRNTARRLIDRAGLLGHWRALKGS
ncbi:MAG TPA: glycosyltransferase family 2 protein [Gemmatimonadaceae bacterium]|nr:glycosyltransferase family 2 protein [Gemmatimonadaceae bacterium]